MNTERIKQILERGREVENEPASATIVAVEGPVCAGKSTLIKHLKIASVGIIDEYSEYVASANRDFPRFPPSSPKQAQRNFEFFLGLEKRRTLDLAKLRQNKIAIDRSIYTLLAFEAGASKITGIDIFDWAVDRLEAENEIILPDHIIYLDVPMAVSSRRAQENNIQIPIFLLSDEFNEGFRNIFQRLAIAKPEFVTIIDAQQDELSILSLVHRRVTSLPERVDK